ncbi:hypothetical protein TELCIR_15483 [Teladorsagia circumcincta]|uniref:Alpha/beta hydrolase fold-3 domain-containing protein n=1 Tax=Teladorsagia circumcincta TaxID=45464 RepID=A0A2G9TYC8_TELCI|nr:hypothetical protein TELCIR_15483 [Teladorsagia circumcincta]
MGDSAGGNLVAAITQRRRDTRAKPAILGQVLLYPLLQLADFQSTSYRYFFKNLKGTALVDPESVVYYYLFYTGIDMDKHKDLVKYVLVNGHIAPQIREKVDKVWWGCVRSSGILSKNPVQILDYTSFSYMNYGNESLPERPPVLHSEEAERILAPFITNPYFSPLMQEDLSHLPPAFVMTCEFDVLRDEGILYAKRLKDAGVKTEARNYENGFHAMLNFHHEIDEASNSLKDIVAWTKDVIDSA